MATKIQIKRGSTPPSNGTLSEGELGFDTNTNVLYIGDKNNNSRQAALPLSGGNLSGSLNLILNTSAGIDNEAQSNEPSLNWATWGAASNKPYIGFATDQKDGTFVWSLKGTNYASGLAIGGGSGNLLWKGDRVATVNGNVASATKATQDGNGSNIVNTYATKTSLNSYLLLTGGTLTGDLTCPNLFVQDGDNELTISPQLGYIYGNRADEKPWEFWGIADQVQGGSTTTINANGPCLINGKLQVTDGNGVTQGELTYGDCFYVDAENNLPLRLRSHNGTNNVVGLSIDTAGSTFIEHNLTVNGKKYSQEPGSPIEISSL